MNANRQYQNLFYLISFFLVILFIPQAGAIRNPKAPQVIDGDTMILKGKRIRLLGVDTPEMNYRKSPAKPECYALEAKLFLQSQIYGKKIEIKSDTVAKKTDRFGRQLAWLYVDGKLINREIIAQGYGFAIRNLPNDKKAIMIQAEEKARREKRGVWRSCKISCKKGYCEVSD